MVTCLKLPCTKLKMIFGDGRMLAEIATVSHSSNISAGTELDLKRGI